MAPTPDNIKDGGEDPALLGQVLHFAEADRGQGYDGHSTLRPASFQPSSSM